MLVVAVVVSMLTESVVVVVVSSLPLLQELRKKTRIANKGRQRNFWGFIVVVLIFNKRERGGG